MSISSCKDDRVELPDDSREFITKVQDWSKSNNIPIELKRKKSKKKINRVNLFFNKPIRNLNYKEKTIELYPASLILEYNQKGEAIYIGLNLEKGNDLGFKILLGMLKIISDFEMEFSPAQLKNEIFNSPQLVSFSYVHTLRKYGHFEYSINKYSKQVNFSFPPRR